MPDVMDECDCGRAGADDDMHQLFLLLFLRKKWLKKTEIKGRGKMKDIFNVFSAQLLIANFP